jgi:hypothetical protein
MKLAFVLISSGHVDSSFFKATAGRGLMFPYARSYGHISGFWPYFLGCTKVLGNMNLRDINITSKYPVT